MGVDGSSYIDHSVNTIKDLSVKVLSDFIDINSDDNDNNWEQINRRSGVDINSSTVL